MVMYLTFPKTNVNFNNCADFGNRRVDFANKRAKRKAADSCDLL